MYEAIIYCNFKLHFDKEFLYKLTILKCCKNSLFFFKVPQQNELMWGLPKSFHLERHFVSAYSPKTQLRAKIACAEFHLWSLQSKSLFFIQPSSSHSKYS